MREPGPPRRLRHQARPAVAGLVMALALTTAVPLAWAQMAVSASDGHTLSTGSLEQPTNPGIAAGTCVLVVGDAIVVSWTRTASTWADGYEVLRSTTSGGPYSVVGAVTGQATESYTDSPLAFSTNYYYVVRATKGAWRSATTAEVSRTTRSSLCL